MQKVLGPAVVWAVLSVWSWSASGQTGGDQPAVEQPTAPTAMTTPAMTGPLTANPNPTSVDAGFLGPVYVTGAVSGLGLWQNNKFPDQQHTQASLSNGHMFLQKTEGLFQYYLDVGAYTIPTLGAPYFGTATTVGDFYGPLPIAWAKIAPTDNFYIQGGKLPTLIGAENAFTFQNMNIERGLLFAQEPTISRGGQLGYTQGPLALALSWNDGFYSNRYTWLSGSGTYTFDPANTVVLAAGGNFAHTAKVTTTTPFFQTTAVPLFQNNETLFTLSYTYNLAPWTVTPYFQFTHVPAASSIGAFSSASTIGGAILANYSFGTIRPCRESACRSVSSTSARPAAPRPVRPICCTGPAATLGRSPFRRPISTRSSLPGRKSLMSAPAARPPAWCLAQTAPIRRRLAA